MKNTEPRPHMTKVVERNIKVLLDRAKQEEKKKTKEAKIADAITRFTGSLVFVYIHLVLFGIWILWNLEVFGLKPFDPSFVVLAMFASVEAIFLSTFVLISQNRMNEQADKRAELALQITLLSEHEITRVLTIVNEIARKLEIPVSNDEEIDELSQDVHPEKVMDTMEHFKQRGDQQQP
jgi:uncharacterized membrane protein